MAKPTQSTGRQLESCHTWLRASLWWYPSFVFQMPLSKVLTQNLHNIKAICDWCEHLIKPLHLPFRCSSDEQQEAEAWRGLNRVGSSWWRDWNCNETWRGWTRTRGVGWGNRNCNKMAFFLQLQLLLWKNLTLRKRHWGRLLIEIIWPLFLFVILFLVRLRGLKKFHHECKCSNLPFPMICIY